MATISTDSAGRRIIQVFDANNKRWAIRLGKVTMDVARDMKRHIEILAQAQITNSNVKDETARWLAGVGAKLYARFQAIGLVGAKSAVQSHRLETFMAQCIEVRTDLGISARKNLGLASRVIAKFFGDCQLRSVTPGDADRFAIAMKRDYAPSTAARMVKWAKQFFGMALRQEKIQKNPFEGVRLPNNDATTRIAFIDLPTAYRVLEACPDAEWRLLFALSRFGGLRCPSEHLALTWDDVNWERGRFRVGGKTGERWVPIFPELRPYLEEVYALSGGSPFVIKRYRTCNMNLRTQLTRIIQRAGVKWWPRPFHNLRSTRQTELERKFPLHIVCKWLGNSTTIAARHYLQVQDADFEEAIDAASAHQKTYQSDSIGSGQKRHEESENNGKHEECGEMPGKEKPR